MAGRVKQICKSHKGENDIYLRISNRYDSLQSKTLIDGPIHVVSSPWLVSSVEQITCHAPATDDIDNTKCSVNIKYDPLTIYDDDDELEFNDASTLLGH